MTPLLDVNVLVALAWPTHVHHHRAAAWFADHVPAAWATAPITQAGLIRSRRTGRSFRMPGPRAKRPPCCAPLTDLTGHMLWPDDVDLVRERAGTFDRLHG